ncbi:MAG: hypothetical protein K2M55_03440 [Muribaculaceae bacterium]|nr:hypothetical protein [Muribaculaceae bacterium]
MTIENGRPYMSAVAAAGLLIIMCATVAPFFLRAHAWAQDSYRYVYSAGALMVFVARLFSGRRSTDMRLRRLYRLEVWEGIIFMVAAAFLFFTGAALRDWVAFTIAGAALQVYTSFAIPAREAKVAQK